jgi:DNA-binding LacI/PurR family transcriptional regulator
MAGLIFTTPPKLFEGTEIIEDSEIPKLSIGPGPVYKLPSVSQDFTGILREMAKYLSEKKRKRTSLLVYSRQLHVPGYLDDAVNELKKHGLETHNFWIHGMDILFPNSGANITRLMMRDKKFRPDSIIILDDNLIPGVVEGLRASKVRIPDDVKLVAMVNFPYNEKLKAPVKMFGFDIPEQLRLAKIKLEAIRQNLKYDKTTTIKFVSDTEYAGKKRG